MNDTLIYFLKASVATTILYLVYLFLYRKDTFHIRNRWYLIFTLIFPLILPLLKIPLWFGPEIKVPSFLAVSSPVTTDFRVVSGGMDRVDFPDSHDLAAMIYLSFAAVLIVRIVLACLGTLRIIRRGSIIGKGFPKIVVSNLEHPVFSFYPYVVMTRKTYESDDFSDVLAHERTHVRQGHTFDLLLCELITAFQWFNLFVYFIKRSIILNHEYIADQSILQDLTKTKEYQYKLLLLHTKTRVIPLVHNYSSLIKNRLIMINKKSTSKNAIWKNLIILPVLSILMFFLSCESVSLQTDRQKLALSDVSQMSIRKYLQEYVIYPQEAWNTLDTGIVFVVVQMDKGGVIKECQSYIDQSKVDAPMLGEIVITGYKPAEPEAAAEGPPSYASLITECERVANQLVELDILEWKEGNVRFTLVFHFTMV